MRVDLMNHNKEAYEKIQGVFNESNKTCVVQPTGSGKTYLILKLIEDYKNLDRDIIVIEPQRYIFAQIKEKMNKYDLPEDRVKFITYSALGKMDGDKISKFNSPCLVVVDEMHRAGARTWIKGLQIMFENLPKDCKYIGLSATPIRYLDGKRDMCQELFDGNIANEISLPDAILKRILPLPRYIAGLYTYENEVNVITKKIQRSSNSEKEKEELMEEVKQMKRNLDKSKGISSIFKKYIISAKGKYVAFCRDIKHLQIMRECLEEWFAEAGIKINMYEVHYKNPNKNEDFQAFKNDAGLAVCLSVGMLSEGVHGIDGVILLRDTISPNLYYQQIGRVFAVEMESVPVIFDLVANCKSVMDRGLKNDLLGAINKRDKDKKDKAGIGDGEEENDNGNEITKEDIENFFVFDQVLDAVSAFKGIEGRLKGSWDLNIRGLEQFKEREGDCDVPQKHVEILEDGMKVNLGSWVSNMRSAKKSKGKSSLTNEKINQLDTLKFIWDVKRYYFDNKVNEVQNFVDLHGRLPKTDFQDKNEKRLTGFLICERAYKKEAGNNYPEWRKEKMEEIKGFTWNPSEDYFYKGVQYFKQYTTDSNNYVIPKNYKTNDGFNLSSWASSQKNKYRRGELKERELKVLKNVGFVFSTREKNFDRNFLALCEYIDAYKCDSNIEQMTEYKGIKLGAFVSNMRQMYKNNSISEYRISKLQSINFIWNVKDDIWEKRLQELYQFKNQNGNFKIPKKDKNYKTLYEWVSSQKKDYKKGKMNVERIQKLKAIGYDIEKEIKRNTQKAIR